MYQPFPGAECLIPSPEAQAMLDWAASQGVHWPKIVYPVRFPPGYIGSMAIAEIHPGERIITAPNRSLFTVKVAQSSELRPIFEQCPEKFQRPMLLLATFLIWEKHKGVLSTWAPFIKYQSDQPSNTQDWAAEELEELQDPDLSFDVRPI